MVVWAYLFIPQIFFYGMSALIGAILNTATGSPRRCGPRINILVVISFGILYVMTVGLDKTPGTSPPPVELLGIGTALGVVMQTVALFPSLRRPVPWRPMLGFRPGEVTEMGRMASWCRSTRSPRGRQPGRPDHRGRGLGRLNGYSHTPSPGLFQLRTPSSASRSSPAAARISEHARARRYRWSGRFLDRRAAGLSIVVPAGYLPLRSRAAG